MTRNTLIAAALCGLLILYGCGGGTHTDDPQPPPPVVTPPPPPPQPPAVFPALPPQEIRHAQQAPITHFGDTLHIGANVAPPAHWLDRGVRYRGISTSLGYVRDGVGADRLIAYLQHDAIENGRQYGRAAFTRAFGVTPPTIRLAAGATAQDIHEIVRAVQILNAALPSEWQLQVASQPGHAHQERPGEILVHFLPVDDWPLEFQSPDGLVVGVAESFITPSGEMTGARVYVDSVQSIAVRFETLLHELIHALGRDHADPARFPDTIMIAEGFLFHPYGVFALDREALLAVYGWLPIGATPSEIGGVLGEWGSTSYHIRGDIDAVDGAAFGVAYRNGLSQPWATGPTPWTNLSDNTELFGTVEWEGALMGFDRDTGHHVGSDADLEIDLDTLAGDLDFTNMQAWATGDQIALGPGTVWGDGDLAYSVRVRGNTFQTV